MSMEDNTRLRPCCYHKQLNEAIDTLRYHQAVGGATLHNFEIRYDDGDVTLPMLVSFCADHLTHIHAHDVVISTPRLTQEIVNTVSGLLRRTTVERKGKRPEHCVKSLLLVTGRGDLSRECVEDMTRTLREDARCKVAIVENCVTLVAMQNDENGTALSLFGSVPIVAEARQNIGILCVCTLESFAREMAGHLKRVSRSRIISTDNGTATSRSEQGQQ